MYLLQTLPAHGMPLSPAAWRCVPSLSGCPEVAVPTSGVRAGQAPVPMSFCRKGPCATLCAPSKDVVCVQEPLGTVASMVSATISQDPVARPWQWPVPQRAWLQHHTWHSPCQSHPIPPQDRSRAIPSVTPPGARLFPSSSLVASLVSPHSVPHTPGALLAQPGSNV